MRALVMVWGLTSACVTGYGGTGACGLDGDEDGDGLCNSEDPCPQDRANDRDEDGVCGDEDQCPGEDDGADADADGVPDGCDLCPTDPGNDDDQDGVCAADDPCPTDPDDACDVPVVVAVQGGLFPEQASWQVVDYRSSLLASGDFRRAGDGYYSTVDVPNGRTSCLTVRDASAEGQVRAMVFSEALRERYAEIAFGAFGSADTVCFEPGVGTRFQPPTESDWVGSGTCDVEVVIETGAYPDEISWSLQTEGERVIEETSPGLYQQQQATLSRTITLIDGTYRFVMRDTYGDGWTGAGDNAAFTVAFEGETIISGTLADGMEGWQGFFIDCP